MTSNVILLHPILPKIASVTDYGEEWRRERLETLLRYLWRVTLELRGPESAARLHVFIAGVHDRKRDLRIDWRSREAMHALRPAVKYAWGVLDVMQWGRSVQIDHNYPGEWLTDEYSDEEIEAFQNLLSGSFSSEATVIANALASGRLPERTPDAVHSHPVCKAFPARPDNSDGPHAA